MTRSADAHLYLSGDKGAPSSSPRGRAGRDTQAERRQLGIPTVQDRFIQQLLLQVLTPIFDPQFSESSYGFRPGRKAQDAVQGAQKYAREGKDWVVDIDITKFFDHVHHDILMGRIGREIRDKRVLGLIGKFPRRGARVEGISIWMHSIKNWMSGSIPTAASADDCNIYVSSQAAERTLASIRNWIDKHLRLEVNEAKSGIGRIWERKFLGFRLNRKLQIGIAPESIERFKAKVRELLRGRQGKTSKQLRDA